MGAARAGAPGHVVGTVDVGAPAVGRADSFAGSRWPAGFERKRPLKESKSFIWGELHFTSVFWSAVRPARLASLAMRTALPRRATPAAVVAAQSQTLLDGK